MANSGAGSDKFIPMNRPLLPTITVGSAGWQRTFTPGHDVIIGRDVRADVRIPHPGVSRAHVVLRCVDDHWVALDNKSFNGMFVGQRRVQSVDIRGGETINIANPDGPSLTFELGPVAAPDDKPTTRLKQAPPTGSTTIGRSADNDVVLPDVLVSGHHAALVHTPQGARIQELDGFNGTFVNGERVTDEQRKLSDGDLIRLGKVILTFNVARETKAGDTTQPEVHLG